MGISGWYLNIYTEKNKIAPSQESVTCVFDKRTGLHKFWSEYTFMSEMTRSELKYFKEEKNLCYPLAIRKSGPQVYLEFLDPTTGNSQYTSDKFYRKNALDKYNTDENFKNAFDYVMGISVEQRITSGLFQLRNSGILEVNTTPDEVLDDPAVSADVELPETPDELKHYKLESPENQQSQEQEVTYESVFDK